MAVIELNTVIIKTTNTPSHIMKKYQLGRVTAKSILLKEYQALSILNIKKIR